MVPRVLAGRACSQKPGRAALSASATRAAASSLSATASMNDFACMDALEQRTSTMAPPQLSGLRAGEVLHDDVCDRERMGAFVESACARVFL